MRDLDWSIVKAKKNMRQRRERRIIRRIKKAAAVAAIGIVALISMGVADGADYRLVEETYTVQPGDTLWTIGEEYMAKNTYGRRYLPEFIEGIKQNNDELVRNNGQVSPGQKLRVTYWVEK